jgi:hypothetical protein
MPTTGQDKFNWGQDEEENPFQPRTNPDLEVAAHKPFMPADLGSGSDGNERAALNAYRGGDDVEERAHKPFRRAAHLSAFSHMAD